MLNDIFKRGNLVSFRIYYFAKLTGTKAPNRCNRMYIPWTCVAIKKIV